MLMREVVKKGDQSSVGAGMEIGDKILSPISMARVTR